MNAFKLKNKEVVKMHDEFNKTNFGARAYFFSICPMIIGLIFLIASVSFYYFYDRLSGIICALGFGLSYLILCITQLQYGKMLRDYIESKKDNE